ncbi:uncharacterized protein LOC126313373 [Schistocerca gregaria]|uniref:uncharacterized protein LOC126313373 n=1 Tax=Schistocerca gregaria TaxID=7010 RepID=UPI00211E0A25|nr:uncharacterized protein LOC126313373 [Schistocerca gregaria]XP_049848275.1 uncharacterized protein LOC126313373 [Schistocerca gregaria]
MLHIWHYRYPFVERLHARLVLNSRSPVFASWGGLIFLPDTRGSLGIGSSCVFRRCFHTSRRSDHRGPKSAARSLTITEKRSDAEGLEVVPKKRRSRTGVRSKARTAEKDEAPVAEREGQELAKEVTILTPSRTEYEESEGRLKAEEDGEESSVVLPKGSSSKSNKFDSKKYEFERKKDILLSQLSHLDKRTYDEIRNRFASFRESIEKDLLDAKTATEKDSKLSRKVETLIRDMQAIINEYELPSSPFGNRHSPSSFFDPNILREIAPTLTIDQIDQFRLNYTKSLYELFNQSLKQYENLEKTLGNEEQTGPDSFLDKGFSLSLLEKHQGHLDSFSGRKPLGDWGCLLRHRAEPEGYESQSLIDWDKLRKDDTSWLFESALAGGADVENTALATNFNIPPLQISHPWKVAIVSIDETALHSDIVRGFNEACSPNQVEITGIEVFYDRAGPTRRMNAFVNLSSKMQRDLILSDHIRCFGVYVKGKRCPILDVEQKRTLMIRATPPISKSEIEILLDKLNLVPALKEEDPLESSPQVDFTIHREASAPSTSALDIFVPLDGEGNAAGVFFITFPTHASAYTAWHSINLCNPGFIKPYWVQQRNSLLEQAIRTRDFLALENAYLKKQLQEAKSNSELLSKTGADLENHKGGMTLDDIISEHIEKVLRATSGDIDEAAKVLNISSRKLSRSIKKLRSQGQSLDTPSLKYQRDTLDYW